MPNVVERVENAIRVPFYQALFLKIAEPRIIRIMVFSVYAACLWAGIIVLMKRPEQFLEVLGDELVLVFGVMIVLGSFLGVLAVLPGIWWLERVAIILLVTCISWYVVIIVHRNATPIAGAFAFGFGMFLAARFIEIRGAQLAPREV